MLLSFSSGLPLGLVWIAIPAWMAREGVDIKVIGLFTLAQAPWSFKLLWSPLDGPLPAAVSRAGSAAGRWSARSRSSRSRSRWRASRTGRTPCWVIGALALGIAFASATQDIAIDAYAVEVLRREEQGVATGARTALLPRGDAGRRRRRDHARGRRRSWAFVNVMLALLYLPFMVLTVVAPEPDVLPQPPRTLREAVWGPFVGFLAQHRSLEILGFVVLYKLSDNLTQALTGPFLVQTGFGDFDVGLARTTIGQAAAIGGTFLGGLLTDRLGLGRSLWIFGFLQLVSNLGYAAVAEVGVNRPVMYAAQAFEHLSSGLGSGAFGVLLLRLTQKRFSATQYALLSSLFTLPRVLAGPHHGVLADAMGWRDFFFLTVLFGVPGMVMLARFVPWGARDVNFEVAAPSWGPPISRAAAGLVECLGGASRSWPASAGSRSSRGSPACARAAGSAAGSAIAAAWSPASVADWTTTFGLAVLALLGGLATAATLVARRGLRRE